MVAFGDGGVSHMLIGDSGLSVTVCNGNGKVSHTFIGDSLQWRQWGLQQQRRRLGYFWVSATVGFLIDLSVTVGFGNGGIYQRRWLRRQTTCYDEDGVQR